jgi:1-acyl-sn-glycerol-3-phosphate acyltransferase
LYFCWLMKILLIPIIIVYRVYFALVFFLVLLVLYPIFWILLLRKENYGRVFKLKVFTAKLILFLDFVWLVHKEEKPLLEEGPFVICANHASYLDIILMYRILPHKRFLFIGKSELLKWPIINIFFKKVDIAVNREKRSSGMRSIIRAKNELKNGWSIVIFPEGGIPVDTPILASFKNGAFKLAIDSQVPILPITILDNWKLFNVDPLLTGPARPGVSRVIIHKPIPTNGLGRKDYINLRQQTFDTINAPLLEHKSKK